jgi:hypothetical protein
MFVARHEKRAVLERMLRAAGVERALVFTRTKHGANRLSEQLERAGIGSAAIHGNKSQRASGRYKTSAGASPASWSPLTSRLAASTWMAYRMSSTSTYRTLPKVMCTGSVARGAPAQQEAPCPCATRSTRGACCGILSGSFASACPWSARMDR